MLAETDTFSFADYLEVRIFILLLTIFYYEGNFEEAFVYAKEHGIKPFDLMRTAQGMVDSAPENFRRLIEDFSRETREELFDSPEECVAWARKHLPELLSGDVGGNLLSKYSMKGRFYITQDSVNFLEMVIANALQGHITASDREELAAIAGYLRTVLLHVPFREAMRRSEIFTSPYDVAAWSANRDGQPLATFREPQPVAWRTHMNPKIRDVFEHRLATFGEHPSTIGKFARTVFAKDLRLTLERLPVGTSSESLTKS
jgi:hypothetical protein